MFEVGAIELGLERRTRRRAGTCGGRCSAADGAERQPLDVLVLRQVLPDAIGVAAGPHRGIADRQRADLAAPPSDSAPAATARRRARRRCCRSRTPNRPAAAATRRPRRAPADRGSRSRTRRGSSRWSSGRPGIRARAAAARSSSSSSDAISACSVASSGRRAPCGGMTPARSLRTTFSHISALFATCATSAFSSTSPPDLRRALWQVTQVLVDRRLWAGIRAGPGTRGRDRDVGVRDSGFGVRDSGFETWNAGALVA